MEIFETRRNRGGYFKPIEDRYENWLSIGTFFVNKKKRVCLANYLTDYYFNHQNEQKNLAEMCEMRLKHYSLRMR